MCVVLSTFDLGGEDLADQYPRDRAEAHGEHDDERAQRRQRHVTDGGRHVVPVLLGAEKAADDERADAHHGRRAQQQDLPALSVHHVHGRVRGRHRDDAHDDRRRVRLDPAAGLLHCGP